MVKKIFKRKKKARYRISSETKDGKAPKEKMTVEQKFYWVRTGVAFLSAILGILLFNLKGWWMFLYMFMFLVGWPFIQSLLIFRLPYRKGEWDWKKILKTGVGAHFFTFMLISTILFSIITYPEYADQVNNRADTYKISISNNIAYVADGENGFLILEASNINNLDLLGKFTSNNEIFVDVLIDNELAIIKSLSNKIFFVNIEDYTNPELIETVIFNNTLHSMIISNSSLYIASDAGLVVIDYGNLENIVLDTYQENTKYNSLVIDKNYIFITDNVGNLYYYNLTGTISTNHIDTGLNTAINTIKMEILNDTLYVVSNNTQIELYNISTISNLVLYDSLSLNGTTYDLLIKNESFLLLAKGTEGIQIIDLMNVDSLSEANISLYNTVGDCLYLELIETKILISEGVKGYTVFNLENPISAEEDKVTRQKTIPFGWNWIFLSGITIVFILTFELHRNKHQNR